VSSKSLTEIVSSEDGAFYVSPLFKILRSMNVSDGMLREDLISKFSTFMKTPKDKTKEDHVFHGLEVDCSLAEYSFKTINDDWGQKLLPVVEVEFENKTPSIVDKDLFVTEGSLLQRYSIPGGLVKPQSVPGMAFFLEKGGNTDHWVVPDDKTDVAVCIVKGEVWQSLREPRALYVNHDGKTVVFLRDENKATDCEDLMCSPFFFENIFAPDGSFTFCEMMPSTEGPDAGYKAVLPLTKAQVPNDFFTHDFVRNGPPHMIYEGKQSCTLTAYKMPNLDEFFVSYRSSGGLWGEFLKKNEEGSWVPVKRFRSPIKKE